MARYAAALSGKSYTAGSRFEVRGIPRDWDWTDLVAILNAADQPWPQLAKGRVISRKPMASHGAARDYSTWIVIAEQGPPVETYEIAGHMIAIDMCEALQAQEANENSDTGKSDTKTTTKDEMDADLDDELGQDVPPSGGPTTAPRPWVRPAGLAPPWSLRHAAPTTPQTSVPSSAEYQRVSALEKRMMDMEQQLHLSTSRQQEFETKTTGQHDQVMNALATLLARSNAPQV
jgi:hypothetical protein